MIFSWQEPTGVILPVFSGATKYIKYLDVGKSIDLTYKVVADVNAKPGLYQLDMTLSAQSVINSTKSVVSTAAGVMVGGVTDFDVAFSESTAGQTSLSVANTGNNPAQSVSVVIPQQDNFRVTGTNSAIIGNLDKGDYTLVSFQIASSALGNFTGTRGNSPGNFTASRRQGFNQSNNNPNNLRVEIQYTDTTGQRQSVEKTVPIQFRGISSSATGTTGFSQRQQSSFFGSTLFWIILVIAVVGGFFVIRNRKKIFYRKK
jgi:hypothetical protein